MSAIDLLAQLRTHFPTGVPSLVHRDPFHMEGDIYFAASPVTKEITRKAER